GTAGGGAVIAVGVLGGGGERQREVRVIGGRDGQARQRPGVNVDRGVAGTGGEAVGAVRQGSADRNGAHGERGQRVGIARKAVDGGAEVERDGGAFDP